MLSDINANFKTKHSKQNSLREIRNMTLKMLKAHNNYEIN
jgi:hypothetical protein